MKELEKEILKKDIPTLVSLLQEANGILKEEPNYQLLKSDRPIVFIGDTHGDIKTTQKVVEKYLKTHVLVFLGDYVDRAPIHQGSIKNISYILSNKRNNPDRIVMLRGNHEFERIFRRYGFEKELYPIDTDGILLDNFKEVFSNLPYVAATENGILALHGGIPDINSLDELDSLPKGILDYENNKMILQIVWNDNIQDGKMKIGLEGFVGYNRGGDERFLTYGEPYFSNKMRMIGKKILLRSHDYREKGYSLNDKIVTIFTSTKYADKGRLKGAYVVLLNPQEKIKTAKELKIEQII